MPFMNSILLILIPRISIWESSFVPKVSIWESNLVPKVSIWEFCKSILVFKASIFEPS